jgi:hypothetical protein
MATLIVRDGPLAGQTVDIDSPVVIGRQDAALTIEDPAVSRQHARFEQVNGGLQVVDLGSSNGTWVNGVRIQAPTRLRSGDVVVVGKTTIEIRADATQVLDRPLEAGRTQVLGGQEAGQTQIEPREQQTALRSRPAVQSPSTPAMARPEPVAAPAAAAGPVTSRVELAPAEAIPAPAAAAAPASAPTLTPFSPPTFRKRRGAASRMPAPIAFTFLTVIATGVVLILYFALWAPPR